MRLVVLFVLVASPVLGADIIPAVNHRFGAETEEVPSFQRHVLPLLGRAGCNSRSCHGSFQGQGGFRLSLFGYDFQADHEALTKGDKPRVDVNDPEGSLAIQKPTLMMPHKGGERFPLDGWENRLLVRWIESGARAIEPGDPRFERLEVVPSRIEFKHEGEKVPLKVLAHWSDGSIEEVTPLARFRTNDESIAEVDLEGVVHSLSAGDTHIVAFYDNGVVPVEVLRPLSERSGDRYPNVPAPTEIDKHVVTKLRSLGIVQSELSTDEEFLRRVSLDMTGTLPAADEIQAFLSDMSADKRGRKIDELLERPSFSAWWATRLCDMTGNNPRNFLDSQLGQQMSSQWYAWIYKRLQDKVPYDQMVEGMVLGLGRKPNQDYKSYVEEMSSYYRKDSPVDFAEHPSLPHFWARRTFNDPAERSMAFAYSFLGVRLQCAQCHKHPFDQWTQTDFNEFADFFRPVTYGPPVGENTYFRELQKSVGRDQKQQRAMIDSGKPYPFREVYIAQGKPRNQNPKRKGKPEVTQVVVAKLLGAENIELKRGEDPRGELMDWLRRKDNPYFAKALVNRVWGAYFGVGIIEPADDLNLANPPSNGPLLDYLTASFIERGYDFRWLHREIANSRTYQLSWRPNETNQFDTRNFARSHPRRIPSEVLFDAIRQVLATDEENDRLIVDPLPRAISLGQPLQARGQGARNAYSLMVFGKPTRATNCDCERSIEPSLLQTIYLRNDSEMLSLIQRSGWVAGLGRGKSSASEDAKREIEQLEERLRRMESTGKPKKNIAEVKKRLEKLKKEMGSPPAVVISDPQQTVVDLYLRTLSRYPTTEETAECVAYLKQAKTPAEGVRDLLWALLNTKEFIVNH